MKQPHVSISPWTFGRFGCTPHVSLTIKRPDAKRSDSIIASIKLPPLDALDLAIEILKATDAVEQAKSRYDDEARDEGL